MLQLSLDQGKFSQALDLVSDAAAKAQGGLTIIEQILLESFEDELFLTATNLDIAIRTAIPAEIAQQGRLCLPAKLLTDLIGTFPPGTVQVTQTKEQEVTIAGGRSKSKLRTKLADEFPPSFSPQGEFTAKFYLDAKMLHAIIHDVVFAASHEESRPIFNGIYLKPQGDSIVCTAADVFRLAQHICPYSGLDFPAMLIPAASMKKLAAILPEEGTIEILAAENLVVFRSDATQFASRLLAGTYPETSPLFPKEKPATTVVLNTKETVGALKSSLYLAADKQVVFDVRPNIALGTDERTMKSETALMDIEGVNPDVGDCKTTVYPRVTGNKVKLKVAAQYIQDVLTSAETPEVTMEIHGENKVIILRPGREGVTHLIMPLTQNK